ncbi:MAG: hypothetical protein IJK23_14530, partial [Clostridia bacterium]|nr:hypothetical protein [Clostridia bacterium]
YQKNYQYIARVNRVFSFSIPIFTTEKPENEKSQHSNNGIQAFFSALVVPGVLSIVKGSLSLGELSKRLENMPVACFQLRPQRLCCEDAAVRIKENTAHAG